MAAALLFTGCGPPSRAEIRSDRRDRCLTKWENFSHRKFGYDFDRAHQYAVLKCGGDYIL